MENKSLIPRISKRILCVMIFAILFGCDSTPIISQKQPFIVNQITDVGGGLSEYCGGRESGYDMNAFSGRPSIVLKSRMYNIWDTIQIK